MVLHRKGIFPSNIWVEVKTMKKSIYYKKPGFFRKIMINLGYHIQNSIYFVSVKGEPGTDAWKDSLSKAKIFFWLTVEKFYSIQEKAITEAKTNGVSTYSPKYEQSVLDETCYLVAKYSIKALFSKDY